MLNKRTRKRISDRRSAFTILELLLVLAILVVIMGMAINLYVGTGVSAKISAAKSHIALIKQQIQLYHANNGILPNTIDDMMQQPGDLPDPQKWGGPYFKKKPLDPWNHEYYYEKQDDATAAFVLTSPGSDGAQNTQDDVTDNP